MNTKTVTYALLTVLLTASVALAEETNKLKTELERISYAIGVDQGKRLWPSLEQSEIQVDVELLIQGLKDVKAGGALKLTEQELRDTFTKLRQEVTAKMQEKQRVQAEKLREQGEKNKTEGEAFLAANKAKPGIITLPPLHAGQTNGLQYKVLAEGSGESPKAEDTVEVNYRGTLIDGTEFDSNAKTGHPFTTPANRVIPGWTEALTRMKPGAKWQLFIPAELAYGERGSPPKIAPHATLIFDVELLSFKPAPPPPAPAPVAQPLTSDIIKVPSLEEMKKGAKIETIKAEDVEKLQKEAQEKGKAEKPKEEKK